MGEAKQITITMNKNLALLISVLLMTTFGPYLAAEDEEAMDYASLTCHQLYTLASQLEPGTQHRRSPLFNTKTGTIATAIGSVTNIGYYYFGLVAGRGYYEDYRTQQNLYKLDEIRHYMAQNYCFQKF